MVDNYMGLGFEIMVNIKHINKNGLSFECPDYYDIGNFPASDEVHKSIVALSKDSRICEIYVMEYEDIHFDNNAKRNAFLLKEYLKLQGYENVIENGNLPYCYNAMVNSEFGKIRTTILFNFDFKNVIMIVGNISPGANYDCINDIKIINNSILTEDELGKRFFG